jgi:hypothetical protein
MKKSFRTLYFTRYVYCQTLSKESHTTTPQTLHTSERRKTALDVPFLHTRAKRNNMNFSERYEYVTYHMNNRSDCLTIAGGSKKVFCSLKFLSPANPYLMDMGESFLAAKHSLRDNKHVPNLMPQIRIKGVISPFSTSRHSVNRENINLYVISC